MATLRNIKDDPLREGETGPTKSVHPDTKGFGAPPDSHVEQCHKCGRDIWVTPAYPKETEKWCGYCALPEAQEDMRAALLGEGKGDGKVH